MGIVLPIFVDFNLVKKAFLLSPTFIENQKRISKAPIAIRLPELV